MTHRPRIQHYVGVYRAVRQADLGWWRGLRACNDVRRGEWKPRDAGEMAAQARYMANLAKRRK